MFSPSIDIDKTWEPVKKHPEDDMKAVEKGSEKLYFNHYDPADLEHVIDTQHKVIKLMKASNRKKLFSILIVAFLYVNLAARNIGEMFSKIFVLGLF